MFHSARLKATARELSRVHGVALAASVAEQITVESIKRLDVQPGDILVATCPARTDASTLARTRDYLQSKLPDSVKLIVVTNVEFSILSGAPTSG